MQSPFPSVLFPFQHSLPSPKFQLPYKHSLAKLSPYLSFIPKRPHTDTSTFSRSTPTLPLLPPTVPFPDAPPRPLLVPLHLPGVCQGLGAHRKPGDPQGSSFGPSPTAQADSEGGLGRGLGLTSQEVTCLPGVKQVSHGRGHPLGPSQAGD